MIQELKGGDQQVIAQLYKEYRSDFLHWMSSQYGCSREVARDVYQSTILTISIKAQKGEMDDLTCSVKTFIYGVAKNKYREYLRSNGRYTQTEDSHWEGLREPELDKTDPALIKLVQHCLRELGEPCKTVLELYYFHDLSMQRICEQLSYKNSNTVKNMKYKCMVRLKEMFEKKLTQNGFEH